MLFTDKLSIVGGVLVPAVFSVSGEAVNAAVQAYVAWTIIIVVGGGVGLRLLTAPYFIWKDDQRDLAELRGILADTSLKRRQFFEESFLAERAKLAKAMGKFAALDLPIVQIATINPDVELKPVTETAVLFFSDDHFKQYWRNFCSGLRWTVDGSKFFAEAGDKIPEPQKLEVVDRIIFDMANMRAAAMAMVAVLTEDLKHSEDYQQRVAELQDRYSHLDKELMPNERWKPPPSLSPPDRTAEVLPEIGGRGVATDLEVEVSGNPERSA
ncbi:hypothetical protein [Mesorhizobium sp. M0213]|uniref:hypothetical protein n=1 Tax=unclassified Mesorhizobium TaxID=325217 RepID=UPI00333E08CD